MNPLINVTIQINYHRRPKQLVRAVEVAIQSEAPITLDQAIQHLLSQGFDPSRVASDYKRVHYSTSSVSPTHYTLFITEEKAI